MAQDPDHALYVIWLSKAAGVKSLRIFHDLRISFQIDDIIFL